jgi:Uri superfamily endonuclease
MPPDQPGAYVLLLRLTSSTTIQVGRLGRFQFPEGWYAYVGSGCGPGGLAARISRHLRSSKPLYWHIDYLCAQAQPVESWYATGIRERECDWAESLSRLPDAEIPVPRFGASDCRCAGHLIHFPTLPSKEALSRDVGVTVSCFQIHDALRSPQESCPHRP